MDTPLSNTSPDPAYPVVVGSVEVESQSKTASSAVSSQKEECTSLSDRLAGLQVESGKEDDPVQEHKREDSSDVLH